MKTFAAAAAWLIIVVSIVTMWDPARWNVSIPQIAVFGVAAVLLVASLLGWQRLALSPVMIPLAAIVVWGLLQIAMGETVYTWSTKAAVLYWSANFAMFFVALQAFTDTRVRLDFWTRCWCSDSRLQSFLRFNRSIPRTRCSGSSRRTRR